MFAVLKQPFLKYIDGKLNYNNMIIYFNTRLNVQIISRDILSQIANLGDLFPAIYYIYYKLV